jgi:hypothetical protein
MIALDDDGVVTFSKDGVVPGGCHRSNQ